MTQDLFDPFAPVPETPAKSGNAPEFSVSDLSNALKNTVEDAFSFVRVRGEISGFKRASSGHMYLALKDDKAVLDGVCWRGQAGKLGLVPEDGMEVIVTGRLTTFPGRSKYQIVIETMEVAGEGALLKLLEERKKKLAGEGHCTITYFGEGAASEGDFHAALNMAAVHRVPVIFLCRNNGYAISTPAAEQFAADGVAPRAYGYKMDVIRVDGNDILAVHEATKAARKLAVEHNRPVLIETMTYRLAAHSSSDDPSGYRSKDEEAVWREKDPILRMRLWLERKKWWSEDDEKQLQENMRREVLETMKRAQKRPPPALDTLVSDVYDEVPPGLAEQFDKLKAHIRRHPDEYPKTAEQAKGGA